jgi:type II secretory pathway pseudopilin PulG
MKASTLIETVVAIAIFSVVVLFASTIFVRLNASLFTGSKMEANILLLNSLAELNYEHKYLEGIDNYETFYVEKKIDNYVYNELFVMTIKVIDRNKKRTVGEYKQLVRR